MADTRDHSKPDQLIRIEVFPQVFLIAIETYGNLRPDRCLLLVGSGVNHFFMIDSFDIGCVSFLRFSL